MAGLKGITINTAPETEPHIYAEDDAAIYQSIFGPDGVTTIGQQCKATTLSNNKVRISDGVVIVGGHVARIPYGEYEDCEIANGQSGKKRNDIIIGKIVTTGSGGIDTMTCEVKQGVAGTSATDPILTQDNIYQSGKIREIPLYRVKIEGLSIVAVEKMFKTISSIPELEEMLTELNSKLSNKVDAPRLSVNAETLTGEYFAGKPVYAKIIDVGTMPSNTAKSINTGIEGAKYFWIDPGNSMIRSSGASYPLPYVDPAQTTSGVAIRLTGGGRTLVIETKTNWSSYSAFVTVKYTKA